jgi:hypothetical protein
VTVTVDHAGQRTGDHILHSAAQAASTHGFPLLPLVH